MTLTSITPLDQISHDDTCFTEGLVLHNNKLYESCGLYGYSRIRVIDPIGNIVEERRIADAFFIEGITIHDDRLFASTWEHKTILIFDIDGLRLIGSRLFESSTGYGWGLTNDGDSLILSDGSDVLSYYAIPNANESNSTGVYLNRMKQLSVLDDSKPLRAVNELEFVDGYIYANVWLQDFIVKIDAFGRVVSKFDFSPYIPLIQATGVEESLKKEACLNGVAFNASGNHFIVTGKLWPQFYQVELVTLPTNNSTRVGMEGIILLMIVAIMCITYRASNKNG